MNRKISILAARHLASLAAFTLALVSTLAMSGCVGSGGGAGGSVFMPGTISDSGAANTDAAGASSSSGAASSSSGAASSSSGAASSSSGAASSSSGATSSSSGAAGQDAGATTTQPDTASQPTGPVGKGSLQALVNAKPYIVDLSGAAAQVTLKHRLSASGYACMPYAHVELARADGTCRLVLEFKAGEQGVGELVSATFDAKTALPGGTSKPCAGFLNPYEFVSGHAPMAFTLAASAATLPAPLLSQPHAGQTIANLPFLELQPSGTATLTYNGVTATIDLSQLAISGPMTSYGDPNLLCQKAPEGVPLPPVTLKDVNKASSTYGQQVSLSDFKGKYVVVLTGAGWCPSCITQSEYMTKIANSLHAQGRNDFQMIAINDTSAASPSYQAKLSGIKVKGTFPILQATSSVGWKTMKDCLSRAGKKNDAFIFAPNGRFIRKHEGKGTVYLNVFEQDVRQALDTKPASLATCSCKDVYIASQKIHHVACK